MVLRAHIHNKGQGTPTTAHIRSSQTHGEKAPQLAREMVLRQQTAGMKFTGIPADGRGDFDEACVPAVSMCEIHGREVHE